MNECFLPQIEQLQTSLQTASDERIRLGDDLQRNKEMVSWYRLESQRRSCNLDVSVLILDESTCVAGCRDSKPPTRSAAAAPGEGGKNC